jgi:hypothetical protein
MSTAGQTVRSDLFVRLDDLSPDERKFILDAQNGILALRFQEAQADVTAAQHRCRYAEEAVKEQTRKRESAEVYLQATKDAAATGSRPSRSHYVAVTYDEDCGQFSAVFANLRAFGNSPEEACKHFDQLWVEGHYRETL